jgi:N-acetylated-alpha-linked acidic dipeptidase
LKQALSRLASVPTRERNAVLHALGRILVPINYTREPRFRHDPAYTSRPIRPSVLPTVVW